MSMLRHIARDLARLPQPIDWEELKKLTAAAGPEILAERNKVEFTMECARRALTEEAVKFVRLHYGNSWIREAVAYYVPSLFAVYVDHGWIGGGAETKQQWMKFDQRSYDGTYPVSLIEDNVFYCERAYLCPQCLQFWHERAIARLGDKKADKDEADVFEFFNQGFYSRAFRCTADQIEAIKQKCRRKPFEYKPHPKSMQCVMRPIR